MSYTNILTGSYKELDRCCKSKFYGMIIAGKSAKPRRIYNMSNGYFAVYRGCTFRVDKYMDNGKTYWKLVECISIESNKFIIGTSVDVNLEPPESDCVKRLKSTKGFLEIWSEHGIIKEILDLDNCKLYSVFDTSTLIKS